MSFSLRFQHFLKLISRYYRILIAGLYLVGFLVLGEVHPFSTFPMYNSFPNWAYTFYFSDENDSLIPSLDLGVSTGHINHTFYAICNDDKIDYGNGIEKKQELYQIGKKMSEMVSIDKLKKQYQTVRLHRIFYSYAKDGIVQQDQVIYEKTF